MFGRETEVRGHDIVWEIELNWVIIIIGSVESSCLGIMHEMNSHIYVSPSMGRKKEKTKASSILWQTRNRSCIRVAQHHNKCLCI
jgi:hypothetical protein